MKYYKYLKYLLRHKYYVMIECFKVGLFWRGLVHDLSKFLPSEFFPYVNFFYREKPLINRETVAFYDPSSVGDKAFTYAWFLHQKRNKHHWQYWILVNLDGSIKIFEMKSKYRKEMLCDWKGAGRAQGQMDTKANLKKWYGENKNKIIMGPMTRSLIESEIYGK